jgi:hypothetical protein
MGNIPPSKLPFIEKVKEIVVLFLISIILSFICSIISIVILNSLNVTISQNPTLFIFFQMNGIIYGILQICLISPITEELGFRACMKYSHINFSLLIAFFLFFFSKILFYLVFDDPYVIDKKVFFWLISFITGMYIYFKLKKKKEVSNMISIFWLKNPKIIFFFLTITFSSLHIFNFELNINLFFFFPILILPHFISGIFFGYIRLKYGIFYSIILHSMINITSLVPTFLDYIK